MGIIIKGEKDQSGRDFFWGGGGGGGCTFPGSDTHLLIFFFMFSLDLFLRFVEEVRNRPWLHPII